MSVGFPAELLHLLFFSISLVFSSAHIFLITSWRWLILAAPSVSLKFDFLFTPCGWLLFFAFLTAPPPPSCSFLHSFIHPPFLSGFLWLFTLKRGEICASAAASFIAQWLILSCVVSTPLCCFEIHQVAADAAGVAACRDSCRCRPKSRPETDQSRSFALNPAVNRPAGFTV